MFTPNCGTVAALSLWLILAMTPSALAQTTVPTAPTIPTSPQAPETPTGPSRDGSHFERRDRLPNPALPYILDYPSTANPQLGVRCVQSDRHSFQSSTTSGTTSYSTSRSTSTSRSDSWSSQRSEQILSNGSVPITIEVHGDCTEVWIRIVNDRPDSFSSESLRLPPELREFLNQEGDRDWLTREGSGWYWLLHR